MFYKYSCVALVLVIAFLLIQKSCTVPKTQKLTEYVKDSEAEKRIQRYYLDSIAKLQEKEQYLNSVIEDISQRWMADRAKLNTANSTAISLLNALDSAEQRKDTSSLLENCDSLRRLASHVRGVFNDYSKSTDELMNGMNQRAYTLEEEVKMWKDRFEFTERKLNEKPKYEDRNVLFAGVGLSGNQIAFRAVEVGLLLKTKNNKIIGASTGFQFNGQQNYTLRYYTPLFKRKQ